MFRPLYRRGQGCHDGVVIVCHCMVVRDHEIRSEVRLGADTVELVSERCGASTRCGNCETAVAEVVIDETARADGAVTARH